MIKLYLIDDYKEMYPDLKAASLTDRILSDILIEEGIDDPHILRTENGKPYERDNKIFFSPSHSGDIFACALSSQEIGLDIEAKSPRNPMAVAKRFFTREEITLLEGSMDPVDNMDCSGDTGRPGPKGLDTAFRRIWTRKEALLKYRGSTLDEILEKEPVIDRDDVDLIDLDLEGNVIGCLCIPTGSDGEVEICSLNVGEA